MKVLVGALPRVSQEALPPPDQLVLQTATCRLTTNSQHTALNVQCPKPARPLVTLFHQKLPVGNDPIAYSDRCVSMDLLQARVLSNLPESVSSFNRWARWREFASPYCQGIVRTKQDKWWYSDRLGISLTDLGNSGAFFPEVPWNSVKIPRD